MGEYTRGSSGAAWRRGECWDLLSRVFSLSESHEPFVRFSFGEFVCPTKTLNKNDCYQGQWREGRMHGLGTYRSVGVNPLVLWIQSSTVR